MRPSFALALLLLAALAGCELIGDILEVGFWIVLIFILLVVAIIWLIARLLR